MFRFTIRDVLWLTVVMAACAGLRADEPGPTLKELLRRTKELGSSGQFDSAGVEHHMFRHVGPKLGVTQYVLQISWFDGDGRTAYRYSVSDRGFCVNARDIFNWAVQASKRKQLSDDDQKRLLRLLEQLPESKAEPPIERTVLVSFQTGEKWRTETYDAAALPDGFEKVMLLIGERFETEDRHKKK